MQVLNHVFCMKTHVTDRDRAKAEGFCGYDSGFKGNPGFMCAYDNGVNIFQDGIQVLTLSLTGHCDTVVVGAEYQEHGSLRDVRLTAAEFRHLFTVFRVLYRDNRDKLKVDPIRRMLGSRNDGIQLVRAYPLIGKPADRPMV